MVLSAEQRETMQKWLPVILAIVGIWWLARGMKNMFWTAFGLFWAYHWAPGVFEGLARTFLRIVF